jgi:hypothetical protein
VIGDPGIFKRSVLARDSLVLDRLVKDGAHPFAWFHRGDPSDIAGPVRVGEDGTGKYAGAGTNPAEKLIITKAPRG